MRKERPPQVDANGVLDPDSLEPGERSDLLKKVLKKVQSYEEARATQPGIDPESFMVSRIFVELDRNHDSLTKTFTNGLQVVTSSQELCQKKHDKQIKRLWKALGCVAATLLAFMVGGWPLVVTIYKWAIDKVMG